MACPPEQIGYAAIPRAHYVKNADLLLEIRRSRAANEITPELARMLLSIAEHYSRKSNWHGYSYREDLVGTAMPKLVVSVFKFKIKRKNPNPFAYFTAVTHNAFVNVINKEKRHSWASGVLRDHRVLEEAG